MWVIVTAMVSGTKTRQMRVNFRNVVSYGPAEGSPCVLLCNDGQAYPITETPDQLDQVLSAEGVHKIIQLPSETKAPIKPNPAQPKTRKK